MTMAGPSTAPLLRELIDIPLSVHRGDFVLKLTEGVDSKRDEALRSYVVTPQLRVAFGEALDLINSASEEHSSKAAYLHGSFGSGKSHFMAVLHAMLDGHQATLDRRDFGDVAARHSWLGTRRFLLIPYHLTGSESLEAAILGGYVHHVRQHHPDKTIPQVYRAQGLLDDARGLREKLGDEQFLAGLSKQADATWGDLGQAMTVEKLDQGFDAPIDSDASNELIAKVIESYFPSYVDSVRGAANAFIPLDQGLSAISKHAKGLGYDGIVLFLDELVLWLAGKIGDQAFISRETEKVAKLVEAGDANRPAPIISFIARQRDLRELGIGAERTGAELQSFHDRLNHWDGRIERITLEDRNLPLIAQERVLKPMPGKAEVLNQAFQRTNALPGWVRDVLLGTGDGDGFARTYPFSPAFMDTLVHVSSALQRERTALLLMRQILVNRRDEFKLGQLVPLGDLFDAVADGADQPFTEKLKHEFDEARTLYQRTLRPMLLRDRDLREDQVAGHSEAQPGLLQAFRSDDRLIKTLLLAALAPDVEALRDLTARRLAALNHGTITTPIPGQEVGEVVRRLRSWASRVAELQVGEGNDPTVRLNLVGVNVNAILERVTTLDNPASRRKLVRELLFDELGVKDTGTMPVEHPVAWRGSRRMLELVYGNVRDQQDLRDDVFEPSQEDRWRLLLDFPFDTETHSAADDRTRVLKLRERLGNRSAVAWLPGFFTADVLDKLSRLIRVDYLLQDRNHLEKNTLNIGAEDRQRARDLLRNLQGSLRSELREALKNAYGLVARPKEEIVQDWHDHLASLDATVNPRLDAGRPFADALRSLVDQLYAATYPDHPDFDPQRKGDVVRDADLRTTLRHVRAAAEDPEGRTEVDKPDREALRRIAHPLRLGEEHNGPFVLSRHWPNELDRKAAQADLADAALLVRTVRAWLRDLGMERRVENLIIATFAELTHRAWMRAERRIDPPDTPDTVTDDMVLYRQELPSVDDWDIACKRAAALTGKDLRTSVISPRAVARFARALTGKVEELRLPAVELVEVLDQYSSRLGLDHDKPNGRHPVAVAASNLLIELHTVNDPTALVATLAKADLGGVEPVVLSKSLETAREVTSALRGADWAIFDWLDNPAAEPIREALQESANSNEHVSSMRKALDTAKRRLIEQVRPAPTPTPPAPPATGTSPTSRSRSAGQAKGRLNDVLSELRAFGEKNPDATIEVQFRVVEASDDRG
ncbi:phage resistance protein [Lentzea flaviverrucosa]|uniref:Phage resistance protein n=1 Tax=Lentzea flaviverrucosa TaxID=200379 RepID=A0A1H9WTJ1_9PSEU|nr:phage resistance protein [Lentzea flaviverrucosa]RDI23050.1 hypothetical protein DFR72_111181 [Lentzea flaviverrucosa]SES36703.1 hypothetical protein SAMN05216195_112176 [Lentzea flaviverrucosa]